MTTTADKLENLEVRIRNLTESLVQFKDAFNLLQSDFEQMKLQESIKPPDPEPLECWVAYNEHGDLLWANSYKEETTMHDVKSVLMREVTPQDEQNRKDAARYRWWKDHFAPPIPGNHSIQNWDDIADKTMKGGDAK